jgi:hypothetical protein
VSVARRDAAEPYITDFWPGNINTAAVTRATLLSLYTITSLSMHPNTGRFGKQTPVRF